MPIFVFIAWTVAGIWPFSDFLKWRPSAILDIENFKILTAPPVCVTKPIFVPIGRTVAETWLIFDGRHLEFVSRVFEPPMKSIFWSLSLCNIWLESEQWFRWIRSFNVLRVWLENTYSRPFWVVFGDLTPGWDTILINLTKVTSTGHSGSSGILLMLVSLVVLEKLPGQTRCDEEEAEEHVFWAFWRLFKVTPPRLFAIFDVHVFILWRTAHWY